MPTENRSSNTESKIQPLAQHPEGRRERFQKWVLATKHPVLGYLDGTWLARGDDREGYADKYVQGLWVAYNEFGQPAPQPHPDPIAWMVSTAFWWTKEEAERDAADTGLPIVGLGPMTSIAPVERHVGEPVGAEGATFMGEPNFQHSIEWYREGISKHWKKICDLRAEVERLRAALRFYADREHFHFESGSWDTVSGEPLNILWCGEEPDFIEDGTVARNALSTSAEPSSTGDGVRDERDYAIEHAGYLADAADQVLADYQAYALAQMLENEGGDDGDGEHAEAVDSARDELHEGLANLRSMTFEFRKRRPRSNPAPL
ncbi:hypothetical protein ACI2J9_03630 [Pseudomonas fulva]|uniref:hypothetical protein n=1 Tax=Pseudomonas fulva TaxID=47880 RepID=UPI00384AA45E